MSGFEIALRTVTPTFCRGAGPEAAELRAPSLKGLLRWWYRAWHPLAVTGPLDGPWAEGRVMGDTHVQGQCPFLLRVRAPEPLPLIRWADYERTIPRGSRDQVGGIRYLGFAFRPTREVPKEHRAIAANVRFEALHQFRRPITDQAARGLVAAWWLLAHLGGLGARSRRGFGSLSLEGWSWPEWDDLLKELPLPAQAATAEAWQAAVRQGLDTLEGWLGAGMTWPANYPHPHFGRSATVVADTDRAWRREEDTLEAASRVLATSRRDHRGPPGAIDGRVTVGLPLTTGRGASSRSWEPASWLRNQIEGDRHASALHLHIAAFQGGFGLCWSRLSGPVPGRGDYRVRIRHSRDTIRAEAPDTLGKLVAELDGQRWTPGGRA